MKRNWKRVLSFLLVVAMLAGMMTGLVQAADSEEEALSEIHVYNGGQSLNCLAVNGRVQEFNYVYYQYRSFVDGTTKEVPTYCVNPTDPGVPQKVPVGSDIKYIIKERESDPKVIGIIANGYPTKGLGELGLNDKVEGYYATKIALWCYIIPGWNISNVTVNPAATDQAQAQRVLAAAKKIYDYGTGWTEVLNPGLTVSPAQQAATLTTIDGQQYKEQTFTVHSDTFVKDYAVQVTFKEPSSVPAGTRIVNMDNQDITTITMEGSGSDINGQFKVLYPLESVEGQSGSDQIGLRANTYQYGVFYASCAETDTYGTVQNYMCDTDPVKPVNASVISKYSDTDIPDEDDDDTALRIVKLEEGTEIPLEGAVFEVKSPDGDVIGSFSTGPDGKVTIPVSKIGSYVVTEITPPKHHLLSGAPAQTVSVSYGRTSTVTYENAPYGNLRVEKVSDTGDQLTGVTVQIKHIESGTTYSAQTGPGGAAVFEKLKPGAYEVSELAGIEGWKADTDTVKTVSVVEGETAVTTLTNKELPGLRILKYDRQSMKVMKNVTFEIYKDGELFSTKATNELGEILLTNLQPGTYRVVEVHTGDDEHLVDPDEQEIEIHAGEGIKELTFFNSKKPGIHLIKVNSVTMKSIPNVRFQFKKVGGSYQQELTTDLEGQIDLSKLEPGAYEVTELEAPEGYLIDDAVRVIQLNPDENAEFVFTNTPKPKLRIIKTSSDGSRLGGVHFRIAKIEDGTHYIDRITEYGSGEINVSDLEPGVYSVKETATTSDHILDVREYHVELFPGQTSTLTIENQKRPGLTIRKTDKDTGNPIPGVTFTIRFSDGHTITTMPTGPDGTVHIENLLPGVYTVTEQNVPEGYILDTTPQQITLLPNRDASVQFQNYKRPTLKIAKVDINGKPLTGAIFEVKTKAGVKIGDFPVGPDGTITVSNVHLTEGYFIITEKQAPEGYILDPTPHEVYLRPGKTTEVSIENEKKPGLTIFKIDSVVGDGIKGAKFELWVSKDKTENGTYQKLNDTFYYTDENGIIELPELDTGWYKVREVEPADGYMLKEPSEQTLYVEHDKGSTITFENIPKSALVIRKIDADTGAPLANAWFRVRYLGGTSGSGGTIIGEYQTSSNGNIVITNLDAGTYVCEEISSPNGYVMDTAPQTAYISGKQQDCITLTFTNSKFGSLLVKKVDSVTGSPISGVQFFVTTSDGNIVGNSNGFFTTDSAGTILISDIQPGTTLVVRETRAKDGYLLDETPQTVKIPSNETMTLEFRNQPLGSLLIRKVCSVNPSVTLRNAEFKVVYSDGTLVGDSSGIFRTDENGEIRITGLTPGKSVVVTETRAPAGFLIDSQSQTAQIKEGKTVSLTFKNQPKGGIIIQKRDSVTGQPLPGAEFRVTTAAGCEVGLDGVIGTSSLTQNGIFRTDSSGEIRITNLAPGAYVLTETRVPSGYVMDTPSTNVVVGANGDTQTVVITNTPKAALTILKRDAVTRKPLAKAEFIVRDSEGRAVGPNNGRYITGTDGTVTVSGLEPGAAITASEAKAPSGYILDETPKSIVVKSGVSNSLIFDDEPGTTLVIHKYIEGTKNEPLPGAAFKVVDGSGAAVGPDDGVYYTDQAGEIVLDGIEPGTTVSVREIKTVDGFVLDGTPQDILIKGGEVQNLTFWNKRAGTLLIEKLDSITKAPLAGAQFKVLYADGRVVDTEGGKLSSNGVYTTDKNGQIKITQVTGTLVVTEEKAPDGYVMDPNGRSQTVVVNPQDTQTLRFYNEPLCSLTIKKVDSVTGKPVPNTEFTVKDGNGNVVGRYTTGKDGTVTASGLMPGSTYIIVETRVPGGYVLNTTPQVITVKNGSNTLTGGTGAGSGTGTTATPGSSAGTGSGNDLTFENDPTVTLTIKKYIEGTQNEPLSGVAFKVTDGSGAPVGGSDGVFYTDKTGQIAIDGLEPGTTVNVQEVRTVEGFVLDGTPKTVKIKAGQKAPELVFWNRRAGTLVIQKKDTVSGSLIAGAQFQLTYSDGRYVDNANGHLSSNGLYTTNNLGEIRISGVTGTIVVKEVRAAPGYVIDPSTQTQVVTVNPEDTQTLVFHNEPLCSLTLTKVDSVTGKPVPNTQFTVKDGNGNVIGQYTTGKDGTVTVTGLIPDTAYVVTETKVPSGYVLNPTPQTIVVRNGANTLSGGTVNGGTVGTTGTTANGGSGNGLTFENDPKMTLTIRKYVEGTDNEPLSGVTFRVTDGSGTPVGGGDGIFRTDKTGSIVIEGLEPGTTVTAQEVKTVEGFVLDGTPKSVKIQAGEKAPELVFWNQKAGELVIRKLDKLTGKPLAGVEFELTYADGGYVDTANGHLSSKGLYTTDAKGEIRITGITGTIVAKETKTIPGYTIDPGTQSQTVTVNPADTQTLTFYNTPGTTLTIQKYIDGTTTPIQGVAFLVTDSSGAVLGPNGGEYVTDKNGCIVINDLVPGVTITAKETRTADGYVLDSTPQSILIKEGEAQTLTFYNKAEGGLELIKVSASDKTKRIPNTTFEIRKKDGGLVDTVTTGKNGVVHVDLDAGDYYAVEVESAKGFKLDDTPQYFTIEDGKTTTLTVTNKALSGILIHKTNSVTGKGIQGVTFLLYDSGNNPIGQYTSDNSGYVYIENLTTTGRFYLRELENEGYVPDTEMKTVYVTAGETTLVEWKNIPITAQIQVIKKSADYNPTNGLPAGTLLEGAVFEIYDKANNLVDTIKSDQRGIAASKPLPLGRYTIREVKAPANYGVSDTVLNAYLEHEGQIVTFEVTNKSLATGVNITKTGPKEAMAGQPVRYQFSGIANRSNVRLDSFYWRDTLPAEVRLDTVVTGTYNFPGTYKITYRVNGGEPRTLADSLSTSQNYTLAASNAALGLASNERVTEIMFVFGQAPAGFAQVEAPALHCTALSSLKGGSSFVNTADVGGAYNGVWVQGVSRWVTSVYGKSTPLPKTGY